MLKVGKPVTFRTSIFKGFLFCTAPQNCYFYLNLWCFVVVSCCSSILSMFIASGLRWLHSSLSLLLLFSHHYYYNTQIYSFSANEISPCFWLQPLISLSPGCLVILLRAFLLIILGLSLAYVLTLWWRVSNVSWYFCVKVYKHF